MAQTSFATVMLATAAGVALLLAMIGIYGVVSYVAAERTHEIGIRVALGAQSGDVRRLFLRRRLTLTVAGTLLGVGAALLLTPVMSSLLYGVGPMDPITYAGVAIFLGTVTLVATYLPARRAFARVTNHRLALENLRPSRCARVRDGGASAARALGTMSPKQRRPARGAFFTFHAVLDSRERQTLDETTDGDRFS